MVQIEVILMVIMGGICFLFWVKSRSNTPNYLRQKVRDMEELAALAKKDANRWKGKFNARNEGPKITKDAATEEDLSKIIPQIAAEYAPNAPTWLRPILQNQDILNYVSKLAADHPEEAKQFIGRFVGKQTQSAQTEVPGL